MNRKCPRCGSLCPIYAREVGRTQDCWDCGARLVLQEDGLHLAPGEEAEPESMPRGKGRPSSGGSTTAIDPFTWIFAAGAIVVLLCQTLPMIEKSSMASVDARLRDGELALDRARLNLKERKDEQLKPILERERKLNARRDALAAKHPKAVIDPDRRFLPPGLDDKTDDSSRKEQEAIDKLANDLKTDRDKFEANLKVTFREDDDDLAEKQDAWNKKKPHIELERQDSEVGALSRTRWYSWGTLVGLLLLTAGSLGFLGPRQPTGRRILGTIVLAVLVLFLISKASGARSLLAAIIPDPLGKGVASYDFSTPRGALLAESQMALNRDIAAEMELNIDDDVLKDRLQTLVVHREVDAGNNQRVLFVTWIEGGAARYRTQVMELVPRRGIWRSRGSSEYSLKKRDEKLAKDMREWEKRGSTDAGRVVDW